MRNYRLTGRVILPILLLIAALEVSGQSISWGDSSQHKLRFTGDFRFRIEHDWNSRKSDGTYREDRSRLRLRLRFGMEYTYKDWAAVGWRVRTGTILNQQDPHITIGSSAGEFSILQMGFEKAYFEARHKWLKAWIGKNTFPFYKHDELFWNDNVFPGGVAVMTRFPIESSWIDELDINAGHFIGIANNTSFRSDGFFEGVQIMSKHFDDRLYLPVGLFYFNKVATVPDGQSDLYLKYSILNVAPTVQILKKPFLSMGLDYYVNLADMSGSQGADPEFLDQNHGYVANIRLGELKEKGDWAVHVYYAYIERYSIVDYYAQNDWARWDYSGQNATGSRLSNFKGVELRLAYALGKNWNLFMRAFLVEQLIPLGTHIENGSRIRLDMDIGF